MYVGICIYLLNSALMRARHNLSASFVIRTHICTLCSLRLYKNNSKVCQRLPAQQAKQKRKSAEGYKNEKSKKKKNPTEQRVVYVMCLRLFSFNFHNTVAKVAPVPTFSLPLFLSLPLSFFSGAFKIIRSTKIKQIYVALSF